MTNTVRKLFGVYAEERHELPKDLPEALGEKQIREILKLVGLNASTSFPIFCFLAPSSRSRVLSAGLFSRTTKTTYHPPQKNGNAGFYIPSFTRESYKTSSSTAMPTTRMMSVQKATDTGALQNRFEQL